MKTFEQLTIDELIEYCINIKGTAESFKSIPEINVILNQKLNLIDNEDEKEFYKTVIEDIILEIESNSHLSDNELIKDKMLEDSFVNISMMEEQIERQLKIDELLKNELDTISKNHSEILDYHSLINAGKEYYLEKVMKDYFGSTSLCNEKYLIINKTGISKKVIHGAYLHTECNIQLDTIGQFQKLNYTQNQISSFLTSVLRSFRKSFRDETQKHIFDLFKNKKSELPNIVTCFEIVNDSTLDRISMSYFKINKMKEFRELNTERSSIWKNVVKNVNNNIINIRPRESSKEVVWFKINSLSEIENFDYSNIYKNEKINHRKITWFKLAERECTTNYNTIAYFKIDTDGSITKDEVAFFNTDKEAMCRNERPVFIRKKLRQFPNTLHYFMTDNKGQDIPVIIGYSEYSTPY